MRGDGGVDQVGGGRPTQVTFLPFHFLPFHSFPVSISAPTGASKMRPPLPPDGSSSSSSSPCVLVGLLALLCLFSGLGQFTKGSQ